jgi:toxin ParE1/3/4
MKEVKWEDEALADFVQAVVYASREYEAYGTLISERIIKAITLLTKINVGRLGRIKGTFEKSVLKTPYIISYLVEIDKIVILRIIHTSREFPPRD